MEPNHRATSREAWIRTARTWTARSAAALVITLASGCATGAPEDGATAASAGGKSLFEQHCAACHGTDARGDGPVAASLKIEPPDLTLLGKKYGRPLSAARLAEFIDGRSMVAAHGRADMPVWGRDLYGDVPVHAATEANTRSTINLIIAYLNTIQRED